MRIFLSHASGSKALVERLTDPLPHHVGRWLDREALSTGEQFPKRIEAGIRSECDLLIAFVDEAALESEWVRREVGIGLERQRDLQRPFVLPVLLADVRERMHELGLPADEWIYLDARDRTEAGLAASAAALQAELFRHASELVERLRSVDRRALIDAFASELTEFEQVAFRWVASMSNSIAVLVDVDEAQGHVHDCLAAYNAVADRFIPRLPLHRDRLSAAWRDRRSLCNHIASLIDEIEDEVYRGRMYALNEVLALLHGAMVEHERQPLSAEAVQAGDLRKGALLAEARRALEHMSAEASDLVGDLTSELE